GHVTGVQTCALPILSDVREQHEIVRLVLAELLENADRRIELTRDDVRRRILQEGGVPATERDHLVRPRVDPLRLALDADLESGLRFGCAIEPAIRGAEQLQSVWLCGAGSDEPLDHARRASILTALEVHARKADPAGLICGIDLSGPAERALRAFRVVPIQKPQAKMPGCGSIRRVECDRAAHVVDRGVCATE